MKNSMKILAAMLVVCAAISPAMADGFYGAFDAVRPTAKDICNSLPAGVTGCKNSSVMARLALGYQFTPTWGMEYSMGTARRVSMGMTPGGTELASWRLDCLIQLSATGTFYLNDQFALTAKAGAARSKLQVMPGPSTLTAIVVKPAVGGGVKYAFTRNFAVRAQYEYLGTIGEAKSTGTTKASLLSAGLVYTF